MSYSIDIDLITGMKYTNWWYFWRWKMVENYKKLHEDIVSWACLLTHCLVRLWYYNNREMGIVLCSVIKQEGLVSWQRHMRMCAFIIVVESTLVYRLFQYYDSKRVLSQHWYVGTLFSRMVLRGKTVPTDYFVQCLSWNTTMHKSSCVSYGQIKYLI